MLKIKTVKVTSKATIPEHSVKIDLQNLVENFIRTNSEINSSSSSSSTISGTLRAVVKKKNGIFRSSQPNFINDNKKSDGCEGKH